MNNIIYEFKGEYDFLSNFYECSITYNGITYKCSEAAFQAQKFNDENIRKEFSNYNGRQAKLHGGPRGEHKLNKKQVDDWNNKRISVMEDIVKEKFLQNPDLKDKLIKTGDSMIYEGRYVMCDIFWGVNLKTMKGSNNLGIILMKLREEFK